MGPTGGVEDNQPVCQCPQGQVPKDDNSGCRPDCGFGSVWNEQAQECQDDCADFTDCSTDPEPPPELPEIYQPNVCMMSEAEAEMIGGYVWRVYPNTGGELALAPQVIEAPIALPPSGGELAPPQTGQPSLPNLVDIDGDGWLDLIELNHSYIGPATQIFVYRGGHDLSYFPAPGQETSWPKTTYFNWPQQILEVTGPNVLTATTTVTMLDWDGDGLDPDGSRVAVGLADGSVRAYDTTTGRPQFRLAAAMETTVGPGAAGCTVGFAGDGSRLVSGGVDVHLWDPRSRQLVALLVKGPGAVLIATAVSEDGTRVATGGADGLVRVWDTRTGALVQHLAGHTSAVRSLRFSADGTRLATCGLDRTFRVWDLRGGSLESTFEAATTSPTIGGAMTIDAAFSRDGTRLLTAVGSELRLVRTSRDDFVQEIEVSDGPSSATLSPDEQSVAIAGLAGHVEVWNVERHERTAAFALASGLWDISWSKDGGELLVAGKDGLAQLHAATDGAIVHRLVGHDVAKAVNRASFSPDGERIVTASSDHTARVWDAAAATQLLELAHPGRVMAATWSPDGAQIATSCWDCGLRVWDAASARLLFELPDPSLRLLDVTYSPDGSRLAATTHSGVVVIWDLATRRRTLSLIGHTGPTTIAVWSPDGTLIASTSSDMTARIWDVATGRTLATKSHGGEALQATWNRAGTKLVVATPIPGVRIWEVGRDRRSVAELVEFVRARVPWRLVDGRLELVELRAP